MWIMATRKRRERKILDFEYGTWKAHSVYAHCAVSMEQQQAKVVRIASASVTRISVTSAENKKR